MAIDKIINTVICGDAREKLKELPAGAASCIITSPPYWALRDYGIEPMIWDGKTNCEHNFEQGALPSTKMAQQGSTETKKHPTLVGEPKPAAGQFCSLCGAWRGCLGLEPTIELYLKHLVGILDEAKRVLRDDGVCFVNLGDTYGGTGDKGQWKDPKYLEGRNAQGKALNKTMPAKSLCLIPFRFAIEMVNHGWILRNTIIWSKPNPMPSSAKDRFTVDFEYVFFFVKSSKTTFWVHQRKLRMTDKNPKPDHIWVHKNTGLECDYQPFSDRICKGKKRFWNRRNLWEGEDYWFEPQYEEYLTESNLERPRMGQGQNTQYTQKRKEVYTGQDTKDYASAKAQSPSDSKRRILESIQNNPLGRNKRTTWTIPTEPFPEAHFATFPCALVEPMIKCGCPEFVCPKCGKARVKVYKKGNLVPARDDAHYGGVKESDDPRVCQSKWQGQRGYAYENKFTGYTSCSCNAGYEPGVVLDFFAGSGTVGKVAAYLRRNYILIDAKKEYCQMAEERIAEPETGVPVKEQRQGQKGLFE